MRGRKTLDDWTSSEIAIEAARFALRTGKMDSFDRLTEYAAELREEDVERLREEIRKEENRELR